ncbi:MAG: tripartite tricarboxylate transporter substrate binding protein [Xanthobacteraceae bacterium]|nr:tripartite tricarboxylate transporter substrate binding protein [Xanthobacteraceae bacterium]
MGAYAQNYPVKPVRLIVPYAPGGSADSAARVAAQALSESLGQQVVPDYRPGAGGNIGTDAIAKAAPDGYTIGVATPGPVSIGRSLYPSLPYDPAKDFASVILVNESPIVLVLHPSIPAKTVKELVALAKARPGRLNAALGGSGSVGHLLTEMLKSAAGVKIENITYKGGLPAVIDLISGQVDVHFSALLIPLPFMKTGKLRAIAVASEKRSALIPEIPTMIEAGFPGMTGSSWNGIIAPAGTSRAIVERLNAGVTSALKSAEVKERSKTLGMDVLGGTPESFDAFLRAETEKWAKVIRAAGIKAE